MTTTEDTIATVHTRLQALADRAAIGELLDRYVHHLDRDRGTDSWLGAVFTDDAHVTFPMGEYRGIDGLRAFQSMARSTFERTHHISSNHIVALDGDRAAVTAHLTAVHVRRGAEPGDHFDIGGHYEAEVVRTAAGWRIRRFVFDLVWSAGRPPAGKPGT